MISLQSYVGSAYSSFPIRWIETPEAARAGYALGKTSDKPVEKADDPDHGKPRSASGDVLDISPEAQKAHGPLKTQESKVSDSKDSFAQGEILEESDAKKSDVLAQAAGKMPNSAELTPEQQQQVADLKSRDMEVRIHEMAHVMAGGAHVTSGPSYEYEIGPDGKGYAVGGSVGIDTSPVKGNPEATITKMQTVAAAALAPAKPSGQDLKIAAAARQAEAKAKAELAQQKTEKVQEGQSGNESDDSAGFAAFSIVRAPNKMAGSISESKTQAGDSVIPSLVQTVSKSAFSPVAAYKAAQSAASAVTPRFSVFA